MVDGGAIEEQLRQVVEARERAAALDRRSTSAKQRLQEAEQYVASARSRLDDETQDVARLESFSPTRIWAALKGSRAGDLERERAEQDAAQYAVATAEAQLDVARRDLAGIQSERAALGDVEAPYQQVLVAKEQWLASSGSAQAAELASIVQRRGEVVAEERETREAHTAGKRALEQLQEADRLLGSAGSWSTWDAFGGGGLLTDMMKYDKLDQATAVLRRVDQALSRFAGELADVGVEGVPEVQISGMTRTFDVFFDNIFSDMAVRSRIQDASAKVRQSLQAVSGILATLAERGTALQRELGDLEERRRTLLGG